MQSTNKDIGDNTSVLIEGVDNISQSVLDMLHECSKVLSSLVIDEVLQVVVEKACSIFQEVTQDNELLSYLLLIDEDNKFNRIYVNSQDLKSKVQTKYEGMNPFALASTSKIGISGRAVVNGKIIIECNVSENEDYISIIPGIKVQVSLPIKMNRCTVGVLSVASKQEIVVSEYWIRLLEILSYYVGTAIARERLHKMEVQVATQQDKDLLLNTILNEAAYFVGVTQGGLYEYHDEKGELELVAEIGQEEAKGRKIKVGEGVAGYLVHTGKRYEIVKNYSTWPKRSPQFETNRQYDCVLAVLLKRRDGSIIGSFSLDCETERGWTEADAKILLTFAEHVEAAYEKIDLIEHLKKLRISTELISNINLLETPIAEVVEQLIDKLKKHVNCDVIFVYTYDSMTGQLKYPPISTSLRNEEVINMHKFDEPSAFVTRLAEGESMQIYDVTNDMVFKKEPDLFIIEEGIKYIAAVPMKASNKSIGVIFFGYYIHRSFREEEKNEIKLLATQAALTIQYAKEYQRNQTFLASASHELRGPIEVVQAHLECIMKFGYNEMVKKNPTIIKDCLGEIKRQDQLILQLFDMIRIDRGGFSLIYSKVKVDKLVEEVNKSFVFMVSDKKNQLILENNAPKDLYIKIDRMRIVQAILNVLRNAIEASVMGTDIILKINQRYEQLLITIKDTGVGINEKRLESIFGRYGKSSEDKYSGLGIGLFLVKAWVEAHNGYVKIESQIDIGTNVTLVLPIE